MKTTYLSLIALSGLFLGAPSGFAIQFDLVTNGTVTVPGTSGSAILDKTALQTSGTGVISPFLRVHDNDGFEQGFNTSNGGGGNPDGFNAINGVFTRDLLLSTLATVNRGGTDYFQFLLDLGEPGNGGANSQILLQTFNLYTGNNDAPTFAEIGGNPDNLGTSRFKFLPGNTVMLLDENSGNGQADVLIFVPFAPFAGVTDTFLYLYTELGVVSSSGPPPTGSAEGTFEEFSALTGPRRVPDGGTTVALLGAAVGMMELLRRFLNRGTSLA